MYAEVKKAREIIIGDLITKDKYKYADKTLIADVVNDVFYVIMERYVTILNEQEKK